MRLAIDNPQRQAFFAAGLCSTICLLYTLIVELDMQYCYFSETSWQQVLNVSALAALFASFVIVTYRILKNLFQHSQSLMKQQQARIIHDLRSPLMTLNALISQYKSTEPLFNNQVCRDLIVRITALSERFLQGRVDEQPERMCSNSDEASMQLLVECLASSAVEELLMQKRIEYASNTALQLNLQLVDKLENLMVQADKQQLQCILSNLINNAIEANNYEQQVDIICSRATNFFRIMIRDRGPGISQQVFPHLGQRQITHGKKNGVGLGFISAKQTVESWQGRLTIDHCDRHGTQISLYLLIVEANEKSLNAVLIDDDEIVAYLWQQAAKQHQQQIKVYRSGQAFLQQQNLVAKNTPIYVDVNLADQERGDELATKLIKLGFSEVHLATAHLSENVPEVVGIASICDKRPPWFK